MTAPPPYDRVVVPVRPDAGAGAAVDLAADLARHWSVVVVIVNVSPAAGGAGVSEARLAGFAERCAGVEVQLRHADYGSVATALVAEAGPRGVVCAATHGAERAGALVHGVTDEVLATAAGPVVLAGPRVPPGGLRPGRVVACLGEPGTAAGTVEAARMWAGDLDRPLWLAEVVRPGDRRPPTSPGDPGGPASGRVAGRVRIEAHDPARVLAGLAASEPVALLVMTTRGRSGWPRVWSGSVTAATVHRARCPVVATRAGV